MNKNEQRESLVQRLAEAVAYELELSERGAAGAANAIRDALRAHLPDGGEAVVPLSAVLRFVDLIATGSNGLRHEYVESRSGSMVKVPDFHAIAHPATAGKAGKDGEAWRGLVIKMRRELDACQKVLWLARDYGFDPSYVNDAQAAIKQADEMLAHPAPSVSAQVPEEWALRIRDAIRANLPAGGEAVRIGTLILGGIEDGEWNDNDFDFDGESVHELQRRLVTGEPLHIDIYHPAPSVSAWVPNAVALAYGLLWHVNAGMDAPWGTPSLTPERAAMESRKVLRDMLTSEQRGDGINAARDIMKALAAAPAPAPVATAALAEIANTPLSEPVGAEECRLCGGDGKAEFGNPCIRCGGTGLEDYPVATAATGKPALHVENVMAQGGGVDVEKVMALVQEFGEQCEAAGYLDRSGSQDASKKLHEAAYQTAVKIRALLSASPAGVGGLEPVEGDLLPPVGSKVLIHLASPDAWVEHTVAGYYVWGDLGGSKHLHRVFVRVVSESGYPNARMLHEVRPLPAAPAGVGCDYRAVAQFLYGLLDDIDTAGDMAKSDDKLHRSIVESIQARKREVVAECDGYTVTFKTPAIASQEPQDGR